MTTYVVDASVAVKWFLNEDHAHEALRLLSMDVQLIAPDTILSETGNVLLMRQRRGELHSDDPPAYLGAIARLCTLVPTTGLIVRAFELATVLGATYYDALYVAAASDQIPLVTADRRLLDSAPPSLRSSFLWIGDVPAEPTTEAST